MAYKLDNPRKLKDCRGVFLVTIPKNASASIQETLFGYLGLARESKSTRPWSLPRASGLSQARREYKSACSRYGPLYRIAVVRHPADRLLSTWKWAKYPKYRDPNDSGPQILIKSLAPYSSVHEVVSEKFLVGLSRSSAVMVRPQHHFILGERSVIFADRVIPIKRLNKEWGRIAKAFGLPPLPSRHSTEHKPWQEEFSREEIKLIERVYYPDADIWRIANE